MGIVSQTMDCIRNYVDVVHGGNQKYAAQAMGVSYSVFRKWLSGERIPSLTSVADMFDSMGVKLAMPGGESGFDYSFVKKVRAIAGCGSSLETSGVVDGFYAFRKDFLAREAINERQAVLMDVVGDSMEPTLHSGDTILVDLASKEVIEGRIYLVNLEGELMCKHLHKRPHGLLIRSENSRYPDIPVDAEDIGTSFTIYGRIRWYGCVC